MSYEEKQQPSAKTHSISMENRTKLNVTGVEDVESFDENAIIMNTSQGDLIVRGTGLHIGRISLVPALPAGEHRRHACSR